MKKILITLTLLFMYAVTFAQLQEVKPSQPFKVGSFKLGSVMLVSLDGTVEGNDTTYTLTYRNFKFPDIVQHEELSFKEEGGTLKSFQSILFGLFEDDTKKSFILGGNKVSCNTIKQMGTYVVITTDKGYVQLNRKQLEKMFGNK